MNFAYLDIETTGLSPHSHDLTVVGIHIERSGHGETIQLVGSEICARTFKPLIKNIDVLYTYNGSRFDLPFIQKRLSVNIQKYCMHTDLMYICLQRNLKGGLKAVERKLGIVRKVNDVDGWEAVRLWHNFTAYGCTRSLNKLLQYNKEDVLNLKKLRTKLKV